MVSSGRSGTQLMEKLIAEISDYEVHHEYMCNIVQPAAISYYLGLIDRNQIDQVLRETYMASIHYSEADAWIDSSNKLSWIIEPLFALFPNAKFVHLIRDGRRVCSSYLNKLGDECYADNDFKILTEYLAGESSICPPPEKKFWWPPIKNKGSFNQFLKLSQFEKIVHHWVEINMQIEEGLRFVPDEQKFVVKLEDLISTRAVFAGLLDFLDLEFSESTFSKVRRPHNVNVPVSFDLNQAEVEMFWAIAKNAMDQYGYHVDSDYRVDY